MRSLLHLFYKSEIFGNYQTAPVLHVLGTFQQQSSGRLSVLQIALLFVFNNDNNTRRVLAIIVA